MSWDSWADLVRQNSKSHCTCAIILGHDGEKWGRINVAENSSEVEVNKEELLKVIDGLKNNKTNFLFENGVKCIAGRRYVCTQVIDGVIRAHSREHFGLYITTTKQAVVLGLSDETGGRDVNSAVSELKDKLINAGY